MKPAYVLFAVAASLMLFGCFGIGGGAATPTPVPPIVTPVATPIVTPMPTPEATATPVPTAPPPQETPTPAVTPFGTPMGAGEANVEIVDMSFRPTTITVPVGTTVTWNNMDTTHTVTSDTGLFDSGILPQRQFWSYTFTEPGTYAYHCSIHTSMTGTVVVTQ